MIRTIYLPLGRENRVFSEVRSKLFQFGLVCSKVRKLSPVPAVMHGHFDFGQFLSSPGVFADRDVNDVSLLGTATVRNDWITSF
ncbi:uncharacterized protein N7473_011083 [Penicillium subrubescens]|uniref:uncharacterized protein n=1 Tax=Penicillium subrubescens TaxID=1316194 RepID=UPI002545BB03|nr:uncharacterized protein N7473_011083 [Penicillium subrubescens]KAJ5882821.1 hypothetical protein N7473_011083 [Penicillium subrubescens]